WNGLPGSSTIATGRAAAAVHGGALTRMADFAQEAADQAREDQMIGSAHHLLTAIVVCDVPCEFGGCQEEPVLPELRRSRSTLAVYCSRDLLDGRRSRRRLLTQNAVVLTMAPPIGKHWATIRELSVFAANRSIERSVMQNAGFAGSPLPNLR